MITIGWRLGEVSWSVPVVNAKGNMERREDWRGLDAAMGLTEEQFELSIVRFEDIICEYTETRMRKLELHIRFSFEAHLYDR